MARMIFAIVLLVTAALGQAASLPKAAITSSSGPTHANELVAVPPFAPAVHPNGTVVIINNGDSDQTQHSKRSSGPTSPADITAFLNAHNTVRAQHGAKPLTYSQELASKAQQWANNCVFKHSGGILGPFGENLAAGTGNGFGIPQAVQSWANEAPQFNPNNPQPSHFTQMVWKSTTQVGCAEQNCAGIFAASFGPAHFFVCEYFPQGNVIGQFGSNVQA